MKIFSWVHRQFLHKVDKNDDNDQVALLENEAFSGACDGWKEGILAIGTFGVDLFQDFKGKDDTLMNNQVLFFDDDDGDDDEMRCSLVRKASKHGFVHAEKQDLSPSDEVAKPNNHQEHVAMKDPTSIKKSGERTTLAELLQEDSEKNLLKNCKLYDDHKIKTHYYDSNNNTTVTGSSIKSFLSSKKLRKDSARPIKKTKQLMRKMLRKKIHPEVGIQMESPSIVCQEMDVRATYK